jgi:CBS domain containing-hemolysin-like protein/mannitol/fructose-specific phosphotransferase system IIA component (Ntr-type)
MNGVLADLGLALAALGLVFVNGFFVLVEFALVRSRDTHLELLKRRKVRSAGLALNMRRRMDRYLAASQLGITMASLGLGWLGQPAFEALLGALLGPLLGGRTAWIGHGVSVAGAFFVITALHIVLGEQVPKYVAISRAAPSLLATARVMHGAYFALFGPLWVLNAVANWILRRLGVPVVTESEAALSRDEMRLVLSRSQTGGTMSLAKVILCENALDLADIPVRSVMTPIEKMAAFDVRKPWSENREVVLNRRFSRYPLCDGDPSKVLGFVHVKDILIGGLRSEGPLDLAKFRRDLPKVDPDASLEAFLPAFQRLPTNMAQVVDREGRVLGVVTLEDVLEELVGEIVDEFVPEKIWRLGDFLPRESMVVPLRSGDLLGAIRELSEQAAARAPGLDPKSVEVLVRQREAEIFATVGRGLALPRARLPKLPATRIAYGRFQRPIDCESAVDTRPVEHVFLILTPQEQPREQLQAIARITMLFSSDVLSKGFADAETPEEAFDLIRAADSFTPLETR